MPTEYIAYRKMIQWTLCVDFLYHGYNHRTGPLIFGGHLDKHLFPWQPSQLLHLFICITYECDADDLYNFWEKEKETIIPRIKVGDNIPFYWLFLQLLYNHQLDVSSRVVYLLPCIIPSHLEKATAVDDCSGMNTSSYVGRLILTFFSVLMTWISIAKFCSMSTPIGLNELKAPLIFMNESQELHGKDSHWSRLLSVSSFIVRCIWHLSINHAI